MRRRFLKAAAGLPVALSIPAFAAFPERPIVLIVPYAPGGMGSTFGNLMSEQLTPLLGQKVVVDYKPGANGGIGAALVAKAPADGYTLLMAVNSTMAINPNLYAKLPYDPIKDFAAVSMVFTNANILVVNAASSARSVADLIAQAKANPGKLSYGSSGNGATPHLCGEMFKLIAGIDAVHTPYKGNGPALVDLMGGQIDFMFADTSSLPHIAAGKLRGLAVTAPKRLAVAPQLPTLEEEGLKGFVVTTWYSLAAPAGTPADAVNRLAQAVGEVVRSPAGRARVKDIGVEPAEDTSARYLDETIRSDLAKWKTIIAQTGIRVD